jgi:hypothetical protein
MTYGAMSTQEMEPLAADRDARDPDDGHSGKALESEHAEFRQASIPILQDSLSTSIVGPILAILLQVVVAMVIALTATVDMYFDTSNSPGQLPSIDHDLYITGTTIVATIISIFTVGQIRRTWVSERHNALNNTDVTLLQRRQFAVLIGLAPLKAQLQDWNVTTFLAIASLLTTAIVSALAPRLVIGNEIALST